MIIIDVKHLLPEVLVLISELINSNTPVVADEHEMMSVSFEKASPRIYVGSELEYTKYTTNSRHHLDLRRMRRRRRRDPKPLMKSRVGSIARRENQGAR